MIALVPRLEGKDPRDTYYDTDIMKRNNKYMNLRREKLARREADTSEVSFIIRLWRVLGIPEKLETVLVEPDQKISLPQDTLCVC